MASDQTTKPTLDPCSCGWVISNPSVTHGVSGGQGGGWLGKVRINCIGCTRSTGYRSSFEDAASSWNATWEVCHV